MIKKKYSKEVQDLLKTMVDNFAKEDQSVRQRQIKTWRRLKLMWENFRSTYFDEVAHDWRIPSTVISEETSDQAYYDKPINVFRAYLESIIAALSVTVPGIKCYPDDAENDLDLNTAKAGDKIADLIYRHNDVSLLWLHSLFIYCTEGLVAAYNYSDEKEEYGTFIQPKYQDTVENHQITSCPSCGYEMDNSTVDSDVEESQGTSEPEVCPACNQTVNPVVTNQAVQVSELIRNEIKNKSRQRLDAYGGLYVRVPNWARRQCDCPYLELAYETHYANVLEKYPHLWNEIDRGVYDPYEAWGRLSPQYQGEYPINNVTIRYVWLRPCAFNTCNEDEMKKLKKLFPDGVCVTLCNDVFAEAYPAKLDDDWTLTYNPMADYVHSDPIGLLLVSVQEITNDLISLTLQTIEHGIGQTFANPKVVNFKGYKQMETQPGMIYPAKPEAGKSLADAFFEAKTATLSQEVQPFGQEIQQMGQLVSGATPSLFGGAMQEQKTASGYAMSRAQALQRLQNTWKMFTIWWKTIFSKAIPRYIENLQEDEKDVQLDINGNFINVFIRMSELQGKIGRFELEANESLPMTLSQKKDIIMQLFQINNPEILQTLAAPENLPLIREALGLDDFFIPGEDDRDKQYAEIRELLQSGPIPIGMDQMGQPVEGPSVDVDPDIDDNQIEFDICKHWLKSETGQLCKVDNPEGYKNVLLHAKAHLNAIAMQVQQMAMAQMQAQNPQSGAPAEKPNETDKTAPIESESDVNAQS